MEDFCKSFGEKGFDEEYLEIGIGNALKFFEQLFEVYKTVNEPIIMNAILNLIDDHKKKFTLSQLRLSNNLL